MAQTADRRNKVEKKDELVEKLVHINRVAKTVKGGRNMSFAAVVVVEEAVPQAVNEAARLSATADLATRRFDLFIVILLLFERFAAHRQLLSVLWCLLLVSESFTITSQVGGKADPQDKSNIYVETVSKFCRNCVNYTKLLYSSLFFLIFFSKM